MILNIYAYLNKALGCYSTPQFDDHDDKAVVVAVTRQLKQAFLDNRKVEELERLEFHKLGTFDDITGELKHDKVVLLDCGGIICGFKRQLEEDKSLGDKTNEQ